MTLATPAARQTVCTADKSLAPRPWLSMRLGRARVWSLVAGQVLAWLAALPALAKAPAGRYIDNTTKGTTYDTLTKLTWQAVPGTSTVGPDGANGTFKWATAVSSCQKLTLDGGGWRLPNIRELATLADRSSKPFVANAPDYVGVGYYWTSTQVTGSSGSAWTVNFGTGAQVAWPTTATYTYGRLCVR